jgi:hypothetical protein
MSCYWFGTNLHPSILRTCHQVYEEAMEVLYGENVFYVRNIDRDNPNVSRVKRGKSHIFARTRNDVDERRITILTRFLHDCPDMTHLFLWLGWDLEVESLQIAVDMALRGHNGVINLEVNVNTPLTPRSIAFCWHLYSIIRRNRSRGTPPEETTQELYDVSVCPPFVKCHMPKIKNLL